MRHASFALLLGLIMTVPVAAAHTRSKAAASPLKTGQVPAASPKVVASSKGTRLIAHQPIALATPEKPVLKADKVAKSAPVPAIKLAPNAVVGPVPGRLARLTAYWTQEDPWTAKHQSSTGVRLQENRDCAVDPKLIPYGSLIQIPGMGNYVAVDTGSAVISRRAALGSGHTVAERNALVIDLFFESRREAEAFAAHGPAYVAVTWNRPIASADAPLNPRALPAVPTLPPAVYVLAEAPSLADARMPLAFRAPQVAGL